MSFSLLTDHWSQSYWKHWAASQPEAIVNEHGRMQWWLVALLLLPVCALALDISYGNGQPAECMRNRLTTGLFQCSDPSKGDLLLNCLGDRIKTIEFYVKKGEQVVPKFHHLKPSDPLVYKFVRDSTTSVEDWDASVAISDWIFIQQHSLKQPLSVSANGSELHISHHSAEDVLAIEVRAFDPVGFLIQTWTNKSQGDFPSGKEMSFSEERSFFHVLSRGATRHPAWVLFGLLSVSIFSLVAVGSLRRCKRFNRHTLSRLESVSNTII